MNSANNINNEEIDHADYLKLVSGAWNNITCIVIRSLLFIVIAYILITQNGVYKAVAIYFGIALFMTFISLKIDLKNNVIYRGVMNVPGIDFKILKYQIHHINKERIKDTKMAKDKYPQLF